MSVGIRLQLLHGMCVMKRMTGLGMNSPPTIAKVKMENAEKMNVGGGSEV